LLKLKELNFSPADSMKLRTEKLLVGISHEVYEPSRKICRDQAAIRKPLAKCLRVRIKVLLAHGSIAVKTRWLECRLSERDH
jgi:hypothetical protein